MSATTNHFLRNKKVILIQKKVVLNRREKAFFSSFKQALSCKQKSRKKSLEQRKAHVSRPKKAYSPPLLPKLKGFFFKEMYFHSEKDICNRRKMKNVFFALNPNKNRYLKQQKGKCIVPKRLFSGFRNKSCIFAPVIHLSLIRQTSINVRVPKSDFPLNEVVIE